MDGEKNQMKMAELSAISGVSVSTVYDYLRSGLLQQPVKEGPTKSYFTTLHLDRLKEIRLLRTKGMSLSEIKKYFGNSSVGEEDSIDAVRLEIIDKALELFSKYHYENTKISDITNALNMGNGTFYRYFNSKEELFLDCLERLPRVLVPKDAWQQVENEADYIQRLRKRGYAMLNAFPSYIGILNYAKLALGGKDKKLARKAAECINSLVTPLMKDLEGAINDGMVRPVDAEMCAYLLLGINETFGYRLMIEPDYPVEEGFSVIEDFISHALMKRGDIPDDISANGSVKDSDGNTISLEGIRLNDQPYLAGKYYQGELQIPLRYISSITSVSENDSDMYKVDLRNGDSVRIAVVRDTRLSGVSSFGKFFIPLQKIQQLTVEG